MKVFSCVVVACVFASTNSAILRSKREADEENSLRIIKKKPSHDVHAELDISSHHDSQHYDSQHHEVYPAHVKPHFPPFPKPHFTVNLPTLGGHHGENYGENHHQQLGSYGVNSYGEHPYGENYGEHQGPIHHSPYGGHPIIDAIRGSVGTLAAGTLGLPFGPFGSFVGAFTKPFFSNGLYHLTNGVLSRSQLPVAVQDTNGNLVMINEEAVRQLNPMTYQQAIPQDIVIPAMSQYRTAQPAQDEEVELFKTNPVVNEIDVEQH